MPIGLPKNLPIKRTAPEIGEVIGGRYKVGKVLGYGGFGFVVRGRQIPLDSEVALKVIWQEVADQERMRAQFLNEARIYAKIDHPHVVKVHDFGELEDNSLFLVMEYLKGQDLKQIFKRKGPLDALTIAHISAQVLGGLGAAHALGIVHHDIKPCNIMVTMGEDGRPFAKLLDFGLSSVGGESAAKIGGTAPFMSPEQITKQPTDGRSDIYSMGVTMYEVATGRRPFLGPDLATYTAQHVCEAPVPLRQANPKLKIPARLEDIVMRCLAKRPEDRYSSAEAVVADLEELVDEIAAAKIAPAGAQANADFDPTAGSMVEPEREADRQPQVIAGAGRVMGGLARAYKCLQLYPENSPFVSEAIDTTFDELTALFQGRERVAMTIDRTSALFAGETIYEDEDLRDGVPFRLFNDGARRLYFDIGLEKKELRALLKCMAVASSGASAHEDLVTLIWDRDLKHIKLVLVEDLVEESAPGIELIGDDAIYKDCGGRADDGSSQQRRGRSFAGSAGAVERYKQELDGERGEALGQLLGAQATIDPVKRFLLTLSSMLKGCDGDAEVHSVIKLFGEIACMMLRAGNPTLALRITMILRKLAADRATPEITAAVKEALVRTGAPELVHKAIDVMRKSGTPKARRDVCMFLVMHGPRAVKPVLECLPHLDNDELPAMQQCLFKMVQSQPSALAPGLTSDKRQIVASTTRVLAEIGGDEVTQMLVPLLEHLEAPVRERVLEALIRIRPKELPQYIQSRLFDGSSDVRVVAVRGCAVLGGRGLSLLAQVLRDDRLPTRPRVEQVTLMKMLAKMPAVPIVAELARLLEPQETWSRSLLARSSAGLRRIGVEVALDDPATAEFHSHIVRCLKLMGTPQALEVVARYRKRMGI